MSHTLCLDIAKMSSFDLYKSHHSPDNFPLCLACTTFLRRKPLLKMAQHRVTILPLRDLPSAPSTLAQDRIDKETTNEKANRQARFDRLQKRPFPQMDSIFVQFPDPSAHGYSGMQIGHVASPPTFVKELVVDDAAGMYDGVRRTNHPNLVNLTDMSVTEDGVYLSYEGTGASLAELRPFINGDPIAVATICKKVSMTHVALWM